MMAVKTSLAVKVNSVEVWQRCYCLMETMFKTTASFKSKPRAALKKWLSNMSQVHKETVNAGLATVFIGRARADECKM